MLIVGELINSSVKSVAPAIKNFDSSRIKDLARKQWEAGATVIDVNAGTLGQREPEALKWLVETVQQVVDAPLCLDSPNPEALRAALEVHKGRALINSITAEKERFNQILPLVQEYECSVVALCMDDKGMPDNAQKRVEIGNKLVHDLEKAGIARERIYLDPLVYPVSTDGSNGWAVLNAIRELMEQNPGVHTICGLSNISFGLPARNHLNQAFLVSAMTCGLDAVILNPLDVQLMTLLRATKVILNRDEYAMEYLAAYRAGKLSTTN